MQSKFSEPGRDGDLAPSLNIWKKGIVLTRRASARIEAGYRISIAFKRGVSPTRPLVGFHDLYNRVFSIGTRRIAELAIENQYLASTASVMCHGWQLLGKDGRPVSLDASRKIATAFVTLSLRKAANESASEGERQPTFGELHTPGGSSPQDLIRAEPQRAAEIYNEFDFSDSEDDLITVSFGETIIPAEDGALDFGPSVDRAEKFARSYYGTLASLGEVDTPFQITRREWFLADSRLVTVHVCFLR